MTHTSSGPSPSATAPGRYRPLSRRFSLHWLPMLIVVANTAYAGLRDDAWKFER